MEYDIEKILYTFEDDYNPGPRPMAQEPRNMYANGQLVQPNADGSRPGYNGELKLSEVKKLRADGKTTNQIIKKLKVSKGIYEAFVTANKDKLPYVSANKINKQRLTFLNEEAVKLGYKNFASVPKTEQKQPGVRGYGPRENILSRATRREEGVPEGKGSPGVKKTIAPDRSGLYTEEAKAKQLQSQKNIYQSTPKGERLQWIADNGKNHNNPKDFIKAYEKHFKHKLGSKADVLFNKIILEKDGRVSIGLIDNLTNLSGEPTKSMSDIFKITPNFSEEEIFKASIIQNNPKVKKQFINLFNDIHNNVSLYSELGPEGIVERLESKGGNLLQDFDFIKATLSPGGKKIGGVHRGLTRNSLRLLGIPEEHILSFQSVRKPLMALSQIIKSLENPGKLKEFGISVSTAKKITGQLENFLKGQGGLRKDIAKINSQLGDVKFNNIFGGVNFEHTLAKAFGKDYNYLPRNYLLKGQFTTQAFNMMKKDAFDLPLIKLMKQYEQGKVSGAKVQAFIDDFNAKTNNYADFKFDVDKGKLGYTSDSVTYDLSRYNDPNVARQELIDNIKLTQSDTFQKGMKNTVGSGNQLKLFRSKEAGNILKKLLEELCPKGKASGGRIGFKSAGAVLGTGANCGRNHMSNLLKNGTGSTEERNIIRQVMKVGFDFAKGTGKVAVNLLDPKEFLKLKNWVGKPAIAFMAGVEALDVADRYIRQGIPIKEALGEKWTNFLMPKSLGEYQVEGMREANVLSSPASKRYAKGIEISNDLTRAYDQLEMLEKGEAAKFKKTGDAERIADLKKLIKIKEKKYYDYLYQTDEKGNVLGDGELDFKKDYNEYRATTKKGRDFGLFKTTGRDFTDLDIFGGMNDMGTDEMSGLKIKRDYFPMYKIGTDKIPSEQELAFDATLAKEPFVRERLVPFPQLKDFEYQNKELPTQNRINVENVLTDQGVLPPRTSLSEIPLSGKEYTYDLLKDLTDDYNRTQKSKEARMYPAFGGSQFSEGGITTLRSKYEYKK